MEVTLLYIYCLGFLVVNFMLEFLISAPSIANVIFDSCAYVVLFPLQSHLPLCIECFYDFFWLSFVTSIAILPSLCIEATFRAL